VTANSFVATVNPLAKVFFARLIVSAGAVIVSLGDFLLSLFDLPRVFVPA